MDLWLAADEGGKVHAAEVTQIVDFPKGKTCCLVMTGGKGMRSWLWMLDEIELWAAKQGCTRMSAVGRKGWGRVLPDYEQIAIIFEKRL
jgi:hypothetical protein